MISDQGDKQNIVFVVTNIDKRDTIRWLLSVSVEIVVMRKYTSTARRLMRAGVPVCDLYLCNDLLYCVTHGARVNFPAINVSFLIGPYSKFKSKHAFN